MGINKDVDFAKDICLNLAHILDGCTMLELRGLKSSDEGVLSFKSLTKILYFGNFLFDGCTLGGKVGGNIIDCGHGSGVGGFKRSKA